MKHRAPYGSYGKTKQLRTKQARETEGQQSLQLGAPESCVCPFNPNDIYMILFVSCNDVIYHTN